MNLCDTIHEPYSDGGGGAIVPTLTLDFYNFFHKQAS